MSSDLSPASEQFIQDAIQSGEFPNRAALLNEAVELMRQREELRGKLNDEIMIGHEQFLRGESSSSNMDDILARVDQTLECI